MNEGRTEVNKDGRKEGYKEGKRGEKDEHAHRYNEGMRIGSF